ncbi:iron-containing alcohol dehydrogenase [Coriobacterium glomerans PW2]|uniref:Glycerol dehydrogenase n=1 Tax=Coriobacterium glomerans (strain ATCC 49209 / DSM 20642 / JCM 10262 / PW2) TaxID=700015 RepID=F2N7D0_CORGP|nr:glycerol dehydrogenase [Coriobacterium glomerans]AEB06605.1 iron-containing alcohol dehydrogenase [Coriobacterium glomerans PW2]
MRKAFICPTKYVQGEDELLNLGYFVTTFGKKGLVIIDQEVYDIVKPKLEQTKKNFDIDLYIGIFNGECSREEIARLKKVSADESCDCTIGIGGGKTLDTAKCVAEGEALIICPTIAATDAPTSHSAVVYHEDGTFDDYFYFKQSPSVILIDTTTIAGAPVRFLVSGMGDALATYFEARNTFRANANVNAGLPCGYLTKQTAPAKSTLSAQVLAHACYRNLLEYGEQARDANARHVVTPALEAIIETNILLSGLGFESGGLSAAHAIYDGFTIYKGSKHMYHGEEVAFGTLAMLVMQGAEQSEIKEVLDFCLAVGLPVTLADIGAESITDDELLAVAEKACIPEESVHSIPFAVDPLMVKNAIIAADEIGKNYREHGRLA